MAGLPPQQAPGWLGDRWDVPEESVVDGVGGQKVENDHWNMVGEVGGVGEEAHCSAGSGRRVWGEQECGHIHH